MRARTAHTRAFAVIITRVMACVLPLQDVARVRPALSFGTAPPLMGAVPFLGREDAILASMKHLPQRAHCGMRRHQLPFKHILRRASTLLPSSPSLYSTGKRLHSETVVSGTIRRPCP